MHRDVAELATGQHGVVSRDQLRELGFSDSGIEHAVKTARLYPVHRGVFAVGHPRLTRHGLCLAGVLARGDSALLSYRSAGWLWGLIVSFALPVEVSVPWRGHSRPSLGLHHCPALRGADMSEVEGIPVTSIARTLLDLASVLRPGELERAVERAERLGLLDIGQVDELLSVVRGHRGRGRLRNALTIYRDPAFARSGGERRLLQLIREAGLPRPRMNTWVEDHEIDMYWEHERFAIELDGWDSHRTRKAFEDDRRRQEDLKLAGIEMIRITGHRLAKEPDQLAERVIALLHYRRKELGL